MDLRFQFTKEEYLKTLEALLRKQRNKPMSIFVLIMMTVVQFAFVIYCINRYQTSRGQTILLLALSLAICATQLVYRYAVSLRARAQTARAIQKGQIQDDFWKSQKLSLQDDLITLRSGKTKFAYDCAYFSGSQEAGNALLLFFTKGKTTHQVMVPLSAFSSSEEKDRFLDELQKSKIRSIQEGCEQNRSPRIDNAEYSLDYGYDRTAFARDQIHAVRTAYTRRVSWTLSQIARYAAAVFLVYHFVAGSYQSMQMKVFVVLILLLLLYPALISFTPLCRLIVRRNTESLFAGLDRITCSLDILENKLYYQGDTFQNVLALDCLYDIAETEDCVILYWKDHTAITIPLEVAARSEAGRLLAHLRPIADRNWSSRQGKDLLR